MVSIYILSKRTEVKPGRPRDAAQRRRGSLGRASHSGGSIPPNILEPEPPTDLLKFGNNAANDLYTERCKEAGQKIHPARFPAALPEFFIRLLIGEADISAPARMQLTGRVHYPFRSRPAT